MKYIIRLEELGLFAIAVYGLYLQPFQFSCWVWILLFLLPDIGAIGYFINPEIGAITYNLLHHRFIGVVVLAIGYLTQNPYLVLAGLIVLGHSSFDRALGYGLKLPDNFNHTHLGWIGK
ncbi:MAG: DUF4260 domain-containing protein [Saprospiraceae bacterium]|nr:DUF4260 domain-containing protein [Saprospiraceae bacterium]MBK8298197.1 DUF4260 domain-containing protein [Saprospiraceae bacterium]